MGIEMIGGKKYPDAKPGDRITLKNGAEVVVQPNGQFRIVKGHKDALKNVHRKRREVSKKAAQRAFTSYYRKAMEDPRAHGFKNERGVRQARTYDLSHESRHIRKDKAYLRNPHRFDYPGVDTGLEGELSFRKQRTPAQKRNDERLRKMSREQIFGRKKKGGARHQEMCGFDDESRRCNKKSVGNHDDWCRVSKKNRCAKNA